MTAFVEKFANSKFIQWLQKLSVMMSQNDVFSSLSGGMGATMGLIMIGAVIQIICAIGGMVAGWEAGQPIYDAIYLPYKLTMGMLGFFMCFSLAYSYAKKKGQSQLQSGFIALVCYILVVAPPVSATTSAGAVIDALDLSALGTGGIFVGIIIAFLSVHITKFVIDHDWTIKLPDSIPEGILNGFNAIIPAGLNIIVWYGLSMGISVVSGNALTLASLITKILAIPMGALISPVGMVVIVLLAQTFWFFGIHGTGIVFSVMLFPMIEAYQTNAALAAEGKSLVFSAVFLYAANGVLGGSGNTLPLTIMGLRSKSKQISAVCKAELVPSLFNINEPMIFGLPMMYNPIMFIPFVLAPIAVMGFTGLAYALNLMAYPQILILSCLPVGIGEFMKTLDWRSIVFTALMFPVCWVIYYPFFKLYEKQCLANEAAEQEANQ